MKSRTLMVVEDQSPGWNPRHASVLASCLSAARPFMTRLPSRQKWTQAAHGGTWLFRQARSGETAFHVDLCQVGAAHGRVPDEILYGPSQALDLDQSRHRSALH